MKHYTKITITDIPDYNDFEGYYWYSGSQQPDQKDIIENGKIDKEKFTLMPFVVEANFYSKAEKVSIQVKNLDGIYNVIRFDLKELPASLINKVGYIGHDLDGRNFEMIEVWEETSDPLLENMRTLQPAWSAFVGFIKK